MSRLSELAERTEPGVGERTTYRWWILGAATLANVIVPGIGWNYVIMVVPQVLADLRLDVAMWGILWSAISLGVLVFSIPAGALADRFGVRSVVGSGILLAGVSLLLRAAAVGFVSMFLAMLLFGFALGVMFAVMGKVIGSGFLWRRSARRAESARQGSARDSRPRCCRLRSSWPGSVTGAA